MIEADHHPSLHADFGKFLPKLASYVNYLFALTFSNADGLHRSREFFDLRVCDEKLIDQLISQLIN